MPAAGDEEQLYDNLGDLSHPISTDSELAQKYFDQGLRLAFAFNHAAAVRAFREAQRHDPTAPCAFGAKRWRSAPTSTCRWMRAGPPAVIAIGRRRRERTTRPARARTDHRARAALRGRSRGRPRRARSSLRHRHGEVSAQFPDDPAIAMLYAEAVMDSAPGTIGSRGATKGRIGAAIARWNASADHPDHSARSTSTSTCRGLDRPERAEAYADRLAAPCQGRAIWCTWASTPITGLGVTRPRR